MERSLGSRLKHAWNAFTGNEQMQFQPLGMSYMQRADRPRFSRGNEKSIVTSVYNRIALDIAALNIRHTRLDKDGRFVSVIDDGLNKCLSLEANIDQTSRSFIQDIVISMFDEGVAAIVPVDTTTDPLVSGSYDILTMRVGQIVDWYPLHVKVRLYNEQSGKREELILPKSTVAIVENPLYAVMNEPNSTMQRLIRKLNLLDVIDEQSGSGKLDLIIQLPYIIKTEARRQQAENRRRDIEAQLAGTKYGIAYTDGTERITQLNRSVNNNLMSQIEFLTSMLYSQLGITQTILDGTADEKTMLNYNNRTIEPIVSAIVDEMKRKFLTKIARSQFQSISFFRDPFKLVPVNDIAEIADKFTRNEIMTSNEIRQAIGMRPSDDPGADELRNKNLNAQKEDDVPEGESDVASLDMLDEELDELDMMLEEGELKHYASPYYDPVKAHEYYLKNRELKGNRTKSSLNEKGRQASSYVKKQIQNEQSRTMSTLSVQALSEIESLKERQKEVLEEHAMQMQERMEALKERIAYADADERESLKAEIQSLREENQQQRLQWKLYFRNAIEQLKAKSKQEKQKLQNEYKGKYEKELDAIRSETQFWQRKKKKKQ